MALPLKNETYPLAQHSFLSRFKVKSRHILKEGYSRDSPETQIRIAGGVPPPTAASIFLPFAGFLNGQEAKLHAPAKCGHHQVQALQGPCAPDEWGLWPSYGHCTSCWLAERSWPMSDHHPWGKGLFLFLTGWASQRVRYLRLIFFLDVLRVHKNKEMPKRVTKIAVNCNHLHCIHECLNTNSANIQYNCTVLQLLRLGFW